LVHQIVSVAARQQIDIPLTCARVTEYRLHELRCGCGRVTRADLPEGVGDVAIGYGPNLATLCVYLLVFQAIPVERCAQLIADLTGAEPSTGFVHGMLERASGLLGEADRRIRALITRAYAVCADETVRHEARCDRAGVRGLRRLVVAAAGLKLRAV
jgi:transposase